MRRHILIVGAGFSGVSAALSAALFLDKEKCTDISITVLSPLPLVPKGFDFDDPGVRAMDALVVKLFGADRIKYVAGIADKIDVLGHRVIYTAAQEVHSWISYNKLILAAGSHMVKPNLEGVEHAFDISPLDASACMEKHLAALNYYPNSDARNTVVICGGGFAGLESATRIPARLRSSLGADTKINVIVIDCSSEIGSRVDAGRNPSLANAVAERGIEWYVNAKVASLDTNGITLVGGRRIESKTVVWATGYRASDLTEHISGERDALGRLFVDPKLQVTTQKDIYAVGDVAFLSEVDDGYYPTVSYQTASFMGDLAGYNVVAELLGHSRKNFIQIEKVMDNS